MGQVPNLLHEIAKIFELISELFILVLPNIYSRSDERGLGLLDQPTLIFWFNRALTTAYFLSKVKIRFMVWSR